MRNKGHMLRDGKKLWFSKYSSWTRHRGSASPGNLLDMHSLGPYLSPTESEMGWGPTSQALTSPPGHCATHSSLRITSIRKSSDKRGKKGARRGLMLARAVSPGENGGGYHQLLRWAHAVSDPWRHHDLDGSELKKCSGLDRNCTASCGSNPSNVLWPTAPPSLGPSSQPWGRLRVIWKREDSQNFMPFGADL